MTAAASETLLEAAASESAGKYPRRHQVFDPAAEGSPANTHTHMIRHDTSRTKEQEKESTRMLISVLMLIISYCIKEINDPY